MQFTPNELQSFRLDSVIVVHECGAESPYLDNGLQFIEWMGGHICGGKVMSIGEFAEEVRAKSNDA